MISKNEGIHVYIRIRPPISDDINYETVVWNEGNKSITLQDKKSYHSQDRPCYKNKTLLRTGIFNT